MEFSCPRFLSLQRRCVEGGLHGADVECSNSVTTYYRHAGRAVPSLANGRERGTRRRRSLRPLGKLLRAAGRAGPPRAIPLPAAVKPLHFACQPSLLRTQVRILPTRVMKDVCHRSPSLLLSRMREPLPSFWEDSREKEIGPDRGGFPIDVANFIRSPAATIERI